MAFRDLIQKLSLYLQGIYNEIETAILANAGIAFSKDKDMLDEDILNWRLLKLQQLGPLTNENIKVVARYSGQTEKEIKRLIQEVGTYEALQFDTQLKELVPEAAPRVPEVAKSSAIIDTLKAYEDQAVNKFNLTNTTLLNESQQVYLDIVNTTVAKTLTGVTTPQQALRETAAKWAEKGIPAHTRKDGVKISTEAYVNMLTRTMGQQVANSMQDTRMQEYDIDLIEVSSHIGARPRCAPFQGRIFSMSGTSGKYPAFSTTSYGEPAGLFGINCGHVKYPFVEGRSTQRYKPYDKPENDRVYKESQKQRELERRIRKAKKEVALMKSMKDEEGLKAANAKVRERQAKMREFIQTTGRTRRSNREQIVTGG